MPCNHIREVRRRRVAHRTAWSPENGSEFGKKDRARLSIAHTLREPTPLQTETLRIREHFSFHPQPAPSTAETRPGIRQNVCNFAHANGIRIEPRAPPRHTRGMSKLTAALLLGLGFAACETLALPGWFDTVEPRIEQALVTQFGEEERPRAVRGLRQMAAQWGPYDGDAKAFEDFAMENFAGDMNSRDALFDRFQRHLEVLQGKLSEIAYDFRLQVDLDRGTILPFDHRFAAVDPSAHVADDFFANKLAFVALLNFPLTTLKESLEQGPKWSRREWAEARLAQRFSSRLPAKIQQGITDAERSAESYVDAYKIHADMLVDPKGQRFFPAGTILTPHWNLRDEIRARYSDPAGIDAQRLLAKVMERIVDQSIPEIVINNPSIVWAPYANTVTAAPDATIRSSGAAPSNRPAPDTRYAFMLELFRANRAADPYYASAPTLIARKFDLDRQMGDERVKAILEQILASPQFARAGRLVAKRLGRPLEPFDIWYNGFRPIQSVPEADLDAATRKRYPTVEAFRADRPRILGTLGFAPERAAFLLSLIDIEASRGPALSLPGEMRGEKTRLRIRVEADGMNFGDYVSAVREMGRAIDQAVSMNEVDYTLLHGTPGIAFSDSLALLTQSHALELLGIVEPDSRTADSKVLDDFWQAAEISGVSLVELEIWRWMYAHPYARPADLKVAVLQIARDTWNRWYAPVIGVRDSTLLAVYSHTVFTELSLADYATGHVIAYQIETQMRKAGNFGAEFERMAKFGNLPADLWMKNATGQAVSAESLLAKTALALDSFDR